MSTPANTDLGAASFLTTRWTRVCLAKADSDDGHEALAALCEAYYEPVVSFLRFELRDHDQARDEAHAFFAQMLQGGTIATADRKRGRFRSYLLGAVKHFIQRRRESERRMKRGGGVAPLSIDDTAVAAIPDAPQASPDAIYDRQWALTMLARAMTTVRDECNAQGRAAFFDRVKPWLVGDAAHGDQSALAEACGMSPAALKMAVHRLKQHFRQSVREEVAGTLDDPAMVDEEMQVLFTALAG